jgi:hypothetical protein
MKKRKGIQFVLVPLVTSIALYVVFYSGIESKPNHAGFWIILVLGMSIGVTLTRMILLSKEKDKL